MALGTVRCPALVHNCILAVGVFRWYSYVLNSCRLQISVPCSGYETVVTICPQQNQGRSFQIPGLGKLKLWNQIYFIALVIYFWYMWRDETIMFSSSWVHVRWYLWCLSSNRASINRGTISYGSSPQWGTPHVSVNSSGSFSNTNNPGGRKWKKKCAG